MDSPDIEGATSKTPEGKNTEDSVEFEKKQVNLSFGLDLSDDAILREGPSSSNLSLSLIFERRALSKTFKLTPVLQEPKKDIVKASDSKEKEVLLDLTTPQQGITVNHGTSCPERPVKNHKLVLPSAEKSCRHLFTEESCHITLDSDFEQGKQEELGQASYRKHERESKEKVKETDVCDEENLGKTAKPEDENQSSFSCTLSTCSKSNCDVTSCSSSPCLSSPNLSKIRGIKRTIESSCSDVEIQVNGDHNSQTSVLEDEELESHNQEGDDVFISPSVSQKPQVISDTANKIVNNVVSSTDGTPTNWTLVSGVSPLPSSDPSHLQQYLMHRIHHHHHHHHHHHCHHHHHGHHHHHHGHHHHHHWHQKNKENNCDVGNSINAKLPENLNEDGPVLTSTPIRLKAAVNNLDVSSIKNRKSEDEVVGDFVISSELQVSDISSRSSAYASDDEENSGIFQQRNIDEKNHPVKRMLAIYHYSEDESSDKKMKVSDLDLSNYKKKFAGQTPYVRRLTKEEVELLHSTPENFSDEVWYKSPSPLESLPGTS